MTGRGPLVQAGAWQPLCHGAAESSEQAVKLAKPKTVLIWPFSENICWSLPYSVRLLLLPGSPPCASSPPKRHPSKAAAGPEQGAALSRSDAGWEGRSSLVPPPSPRSERRARCRDTCRRHGRPRITCGRGHGQERSTARCSVPPPGTPGPQSMATAAKARGRSCMRRDSGLEQPRPKRAL